MSGFWRNAFVALVALIVIGQSVFILDQRDEAVVVRLGEPVRVVDTPGLKAKIPFAEQVVRFDRRNQTLQTEAEAMTTADRRPLTVDASVRYRIDDPLRFYRATKGEPPAAERLNKLAATSLRGAVAGASFEDVLSGGRDGVDSAALKEMKRRTAAAGIGVTILDLRIRRAEPSPADENAIFERMSADWRQQAAQVRARTEEQRQQILAEAESRAAAIRAETAAAKGKIFASSYGRDPDFAAFYQTMRAYDETLAKGDTTVVLPQGSAFFKYLQQGPKGR